MSLSQTVRSFLAATKRQGGSPSPSDLDRLERAANTSFQGAFVTQTAPMADRTWELSMVLPGNSADATTDRLVFPRAVEIIAFHPSIIIVGNQALRDPKLDDIAASLDVNNSDVFTSSQGKTGPASRDNAVTLSALGIMAPRMMGLKIDTANPSLGVSLRWKAGAGLYKDALVSLAVICRWI